MFGVDYGLSTWWLLYCCIQVFYLISVVDDLKTGADHLHQIQQEQADGINLRETKRERTRGGVSEREERFRETEQEGEGEREMEGQGET